MEKQEFLDKLRMALNGRIPTSKVTENVNFYDDYINTVIRKGRMLNEIMDTLGDPRLIAKTIIQTQGDESGYEAQSSGYREYQEGNAYDQEEENDAYRSRAHNSGLFKRFPVFLRVPGWLWSVLAFVIVILIVVFVFKAIVFLAPLLIVLAMVMLMVKIFRDWLN